MTQEQGEVQVGTSTGAAHAEEDEDVELVEVLRVKEAATAAVLADGDLHTQRLPRKEQKECERQV